MSRVISILKKRTDEEELAAHVERCVLRGTHGWAAHLRVSKLRVDMRQQNLLFALDRLRTVVASFNGTIYLLKNEDVICIFSDERIGQIQQYLSKVELLFAEDPLFLAPGSSKPAFIVYYDLTRALEEFRRLALGFLNPAPATSAVAAEQAPVEGTVALEARQLADAVAAIAAVDVDALVRQQTVYRFANERPPLPVFDEIFVSIADLERSATPGLRLAANRWLFQYLTRELDRRVLDLLRRCQAGAAATSSFDLTALARLLREGGFSLNLNVASVLSPEFHAVVSAMPADVRAGLVIEFQRIDVLGDVGAYLYARDYLQEQGVRIALDGVTDLSLPFGDRAGLGCNLIKMMWSPDMVQRLHGEAIEVVRALLERAGAESVVLCRCDSQDAIDWGRSLGITLFQGWHADILAATSRGTRRGPRAPLSVR